jgi:biotin carboxyl carrier protein
MIPKRMLKPLALTACLSSLMLADLSPQAPLRLTFAREAAAIVGAPMTPLSVAGVARRTTVRVATVEAAAVTSAAAAGAQQQAAMAQQQQAAMAQQQQAVAQQQAATARQQAAVAEQQAAVAQQQAQAAAPAIGTVVTTLPAGCTAAPVGGVEYHRCGSSFYRSAFQGNNLVYVVVPQP